MTVILDPSTMAKQSAACLQCNLRHRKCSRDPHNGRCQQCSARGNDCSYSTPNQSENLSIGRIERSMGGSSAFGMSFMNQARSRSAGPSNIPHPPKKQRTEALPNAPQQRRETLPNPAHSITETLPNPAQTNRLSEPMMTTLVMRDSSVVSNSMESENGASRYQPTARMYGSSQENEDISATGRLPTNNNNDPILSNVMNDNDWTATTRQNTMSAQERGDQPVYTRAWQTGVGTDRNAFEARHSMTPAANDRDSIRGREEIHARQHSATSMNRVHNRSTSRSAFNSVPRSPHVGGRAGETGRQDMLGSIPIERQTTTRQNTTSSANSDRTPSRAINVDVSIPGDIIMVDDEDPVTHNVEEAVRRHDFSTKEPAMLAGSSDRLGSLSQYFNESVNGFFAGPAIVMPLLVEDQFRKQCQEDQVSQALKLAVMFRGMPFTKNPDTNLLLQAIHKAYARIPDTSESSEHPSLSLRLDELIARVLVSDLGFNDCAKSPKDLKHNRRFRLIVLDAIDLERHCEEKSEQDLHNKVKLLCYYLFCTSALQYRDLGLSQSHYEQLISQFDHISPPQASYSFVVLELAKTAADIREKLVAHSSSAEGLPISNVEKAFEKLDRWRMETFMDWIGTQITLEKDDDDHNLIMKNKILSSPELNRELRLQIAVLKALHMSLFVNMAKALTNDAISGWSNKWARESINVRKALYASRFMEELDVMKRSMATHADFDGEETRWMQTAPFAFLNVASDLARILPDNPDANAGS